MVDGYVILNYRNRAMQAIESTESVNLSHFS